MNEGLFFAIFIVVVFAILIVGIHLFKKDAIFTIAIGAVIGANIYNATAYPIEIGHLVFGIDSIVYTIFSFCLLLMFIDYGKNSLKVVLYTSLFSIFFSAFLAFMGGIAQNNFILNTDILFTALAYLCSIIATFFAVVGMVWIYSVMTKHGTNKYISTFVALLYCAVVNSFLYYSLSYVFTGGLGEKFLLVLAGSYIGKVVASLACLVILKFHKSPPLVEEKNPTQKPVAKKKKQTGVSRAKTRVKK